MDHDIEDSGGNGDNNMNRLNVDDDPSNESKSLNYILNGEVESFLDHVYQNSCAFYSNTARTTTQPQPTTTTTTPSSVVAVWNSEQHLNNPFQAIVENGFSVLTELMNVQQTSVPLHSSSHHNRDIQDLDENCAAAAAAAAANDANNDDGSNIILFQNQQIVAQEEQWSKYRSCQYTDTNDDPMTTTVTTIIAQGKRTVHSFLNLYAAYLDGCSIVMNHADLYTPWIASLCQDLQLSFPHVYANVYITPPLSQAVPPHADDRDVFIVQVYGSKQWTIYQRIPILYPYPHEQVGKDVQLPVPEEVLQGPVLMERTLHPGDVLYMPRGYVHEARCTRGTTGTSTSRSSSSSSSVNVDPCCDGSFHITIAIATHDWTLSGLLQSACQSVIAQQLPTAYRKAIHRQFGQQPSLSPHFSESTNAKRATIALQEQIDYAIQMLQQEITVLNINTALYNKYQRHNQRASSYRQSMIQQYLQARQQQVHPTSTTATNRKCNIDTVNNVVGWDAACTVTLQTRIRKATDVEKESVRVVYSAARTHQHPHPHSTAFESEPSPCGLHVREEIYNPVIQMIQMVQQTPQQSYPVWQLRSLLLLSPPVDHCPNQQHATTTTTSTATSGKHQTTSSTTMICDLTLLCIARRCVELGAFAVVIQK
jgi:hypothetical protein